MSQELRKRCEGLIHKNLGLSLDSPKDTDALLRFVEAEVQREREECWKMVSEASVPYRAESPTCAALLDLSDAIRSRGAK